MTDRAGLVTGYASASFGWVSTNNNREGNFEIVDDLDMRAYDIDSVTDIRATGTISSDKLTVSSIAETTQTDVLPILSQTSTTMHAETTATGGAVVIAASALVEGLLTFTTVTPTSITWPDFNQVDAVFSIKNDGTSSKNSVFRTIIVNRTNAAIPAMTPGTSHSFAQGAGTQLESRMLYEFISTMSAGSYETILVSQSSAQLTGVFKTAGSLVVDNGTINSDGVDVNLGAGGTLDVNIGQAGQNTTINSDNLKVNSIKPNGAGPITIDGASLELYSPGNNVEIHCGSVSSAPPTDQSLFHVEGNGSSGIIISAGEDGTGTAYLEHQTQTREVALCTHVDETAEDAVIEASTLNTHAKNDIIFKVGGQYAAIPTLDNRVVPVGAVEALKIVGTSGDVDLYNNLLFSNGAIQIGDATTSGDHTGDVIIGKGTVSTAGTNNTILGSSSVANGTSSTVIGFNNTSGTANNASCLGQNCTSTGGNSVCIGNTAQATGTTGSISVGNSAVSSGSASVALGFATDATGSHSVALGQSAQSTADESIAIGFQAAASAVDSMAIGRASIANNTLTVAVGTTSVASAAGATALGYNTDATGLHSLAAGQSSQATATDSVAVGYQANSSFSDGIAIGRSTAASASLTVAIGALAVASADGATSLGYATDATGLHSLAAGQAAQATAQDALALGYQANASASNAVSIGKSVSNAVADSFQMFDNTMTGAIAGNLKHGSTNVWTNTEGPVVESGMLYISDATSYTLQVEECVNGIFRNIHTAAGLTLTFPSRANIVTYLENAVAGTPTTSAQTRHSMFVTTVINKTSQAITLTSGLNQLAVGTSLSAGIAANECATFISYLGDSSYFTTRVATQAI